jgi:hypothetical protein
MKNLIFAILICLPFFLMAQKGEIKPDKITSEKTTPFPEDFKLWTIEEYLLNCPDSLNKCYVIKENNNTKKIPQEDVYDFPYEEGYKYTVWVREELKSPPINPKSGIYNYILVKIVSKKLMHKKTKPVTTESNITEQKPVSKNTDTLSTTLIAKPKTGSVIKPETFVKPKTVAESNKEPVKTATVKVEKEKPVIDKVTQPYADDLLREDVELLKKQVRELKKQVDVMKLIIDMQMQLLQKKP